MTDTEAEYAFVKKFCEDRGCEFALAKVWENGGDGGIELANKVIETLEKKKANSKYYIRMKCLLKIRLRQ